MPIPVGSRRCFCHSFISGSIHRRPASFTPRLESTCQHHLSPHPLGSLELAVGPYCHHGHQWPRRTVQSTWRALWPFLRPRCPAATHPRVVWRGPGQPTHLTVCWPWKQDPGYYLGPALRPFGAKSTEEEEEVCVCVHSMVIESYLSCVCTHTYLYLLTTFTFYVLLVFDAGSHHLYLLTFTFFH